MEKIKKLYDKSEYEKCIEQCIYFINQNINTQYDLKIILIKSQIKLNNIDQKCDIESDDKNEELLDKFYEIFQKIMISKFHPQNPDQQSSTLLNYIDHIDHNKISLIEIDNLIKSKTWIVQADEDYLGEEFDKSQHYLENILKFPMMQHSNYVIQNKDFDQRIKYDNNNKEESDSEEAGLCQYHIQGKENKQIESEKFNNLTKFPVVSKGKIIQSHKIYRPNRKLDIQQIDNCLGSNDLNNIRKIMDKLGGDTKDYPIDQYHNIVDPNLMLDKSRNWIATTQYIQKYTLSKENLQNLFNFFCKRNFKEQIISLGILQIILDQMNFKDPFSIHDHYSNLNQNFKSFPLDTIQEYSLDFNIDINIAFNKILNASLPLLSHLRKPAFLLPGQLQVVPKAQSIYLQPGEDYDGVWHQDGDTEYIAAVVLYQQRNEGNEGGSLEFLQRTGDDFCIGEQKCPDGSRLQTAKVDCIQDRLIVFSNYEVVHRVLKMVNSSNNTSYRDFIALFIVDQRRPLQSTKDLETNEELKTFWNMNKSLNKKRRDEKFIGLLKPRKKRFGVNTVQVFSTGNGTAAQLSFQQSDINLKNGYNYDTLKHDKDYKKLMKINKKPPLGRGKSYSKNSTFHQTDSDQQNDDDRWNYDEDISDN